VATDPASAIGRPGEDEMGTGTKRLLAWNWLDCVDSAIRCAEIVLWWSKVQFSFYLPELLSLSCVNYTEEEETSPETVGGIHGYAA